MIIFSFIFFSFFSLLAMEEEETPLNFIFNNKNKEESKISKFNNMSKTFYKFSCASSKVDLESIKEAWLCFRNINGDNFFDEESTLEDRSKEISLKKFLGEVVDKGNNEDSILRKILKKSFIISNTDKNITLEIMYKRAMQVSAGIINKKNEKNDLRQYDQFRDLVYGSFNYLRKLGYECDFSKEDIYSGDGLAFPAAILPCFKINKDGEIIIEDYYEEGFVCVPGLNFQYPKSYDNRKYNNNNNIELLEQKILEIANMAVTAAIELCKEQQKEGEMYILNLNIPAIGLVSMAKEFKDKYLLEKMYLLAWKNALKAYFSSEFLIYVNFFNFSKNIFEEVFIKDLPNNLFVKLYENANIFDLNNVHDALLLKNPLEYFSVTLVPQNKELLICAGGRKNGGQLEARFCGREKTENNDNAIPFVLVNFIGIIFKDLNQEAIEFFLENIEKFVDLRSKYGPSDNPLTYIVGGLASAAIGLSFLKKFGII
jgi:hypothetical protein